MSEPNEQTNGVAATAAASDAKTPEPTTGPGSSPAASVECPATPGQTSGVASVDAAADKQQKSARELAMRAREGKRLREERRNFRATTERIESEFAQFRSRVESELKAEREGRAKAEERLAAYRKDALAAVEEDGVKPDEAIKSYIERSAPERRIEETNERIAKLEKALADKDESHRRQMQEEQSRRAREFEENAIRKFASEVTSGEAATKYPYLNAEFTPAQIAAQAREVHEWAKQQSVRMPDGSVRRGAAYSFDEVAAFLDRQAKSAYEAKEERRSKLLPRQGEPAPAAGIQAAPDPGKGHRATSGPASRTNGTKTSDDKAMGATRIRQKRQLTREEQEALDLAALRTAFEKDRAARH